MGTSFCHLALLELSDLTHAFRMTDWNLRNLLRSEPVLLNLRDGLKKIGGPEQCTEQVLRSVLARMNNWTTLVREVVQAEVPWFEALSSFSTLLSLDNSCPLHSFTRAAQNIGSLLAIPPAAFLRFSLLGNLMRVPASEDALSREIDDVRPLAVGIKEREGLAPTVLGQSCQGLGRDFLWGLSKIGEATCACHHWRSFGIGRRTRKLTTYAPS